MSNGNDQVILHSIKLQNWSLTTGYSLELYPRQPFWGVSWLVLLLFRDAVGVFQAPQTVQHTLNIVSQVSLTFPQNKLIKMKEKKIISILVVLRTFQALLLASFSNYYHYMLNLSNFCEFYLVFANGLGDLGSIPGQVIPKTQKMILDATLLNTQHYKVRIKGKVEQSREWCSALPYILVQQLSKKEPPGHLQLRSPTTLVLVFLLISQMLLARWFQFFFRFLIISVFFKDFYKCSKYANNVGNNCHLHVQQIFLISSQVQVFPQLFIFFLFYSVVILRFRVPIPGSIFPIALNRNQARVSVLTRYF